MGMQRASALISVIPAALMLFGCSGGTSDPADLVPPIEFWIRTQSVPIPYEAGLMITENWRELGFEVDARTQEDENGRPVNWPVSKIEYLDERTVAVELQDDFAFHDGEPLTVEDVKFTFDFAKEVSSPTYSAHIRGIASVEITGPNSLVFNLSDSYAPFVSNTLSQCLILPEHIWGALYAEDYEPTPYL